MNQTSPNPNPEPAQLVVAVIKLLVVCVCATLYSWGGMEDLWLRRIVAPIIAVGTMYYFTRNPWTLVQVPLMMFTLQLGYGANTFWEKVVKRAVYGFANAASGSFNNALLVKTQPSVWALILLQFIILISAYILLGVFNPLPDARTEELVLGFLAFFLPIMSAKPR